MPLVGILVLFIHFQVLHFQVHFQVYTFSSVLRIFLWFKTSADTEIHGGIGYLEYKEAAWNTSGYLPYDDAFLLE